MELLKLGVACAAAVGLACYEPELRDCTLTCSAASDCADGQVCGPDHFCASPELAGSCAARSRDAGVVDTKPDGPPAPPGHVPLAIEIDGKGQITVHGIGTCRESGPQNGSCLFLVPRATPITADAMPDGGWRFERWTTETCAGVSIHTCTFTPSMATTLGAKFKKGHD